MLSEWWPAVPSTPSPLNLKAVPEKRAEIIHGKAWLLDEVAWGGNSCWGGVQLPDLHLDLVTISTQPPPGSTMWASHSVKEWMGCSGPHVLLGLALTVWGRQDGAYGLEDPSDPSSPEEGAGLEGSSPTQTPWVKKRGLCPTLRGVLATPRPLPPLLARRPPAEEAKAGPRHTLRILPPSYLSCAPTGNRSR